ncbi:hypothetical protein G7Y89_g1457 [Cudoniella acicularis]|uniref:Calcineurin-like phosphoesterase domain-containing protein n=1 Tax=Cudoniella acicularis TaxID=354080 RepID=A0A8H4W9I5_9HELO|nr:hypothetical protein G7Y89_g1457 [Cudoniella acicularis]
MNGLPEFNPATAKTGRNTQSRRHLVYSLVFLTMASWAAYLLFFASKMDEPVAISTHTYEDQPNDDGTEAFGDNAQPALSHMIQLVTLPPKYLPQTGKHRHSGRLVVVGDVHGMKDSLVELLEKVNFDEKHDHLILAGDIISKGPDSAGVVDLAMKVGATVVRGNHEDRIILTYQDMVSEHVDINSPGPSEPTDKEQDTLEEQNFTRGDYKDRKLVKELGEKRIKWLKKCPVILRVGTLGDMGEVVVVHAGLAPGVKLEKQDPAMVMNMRTIKDGVPSDGRDGVGWMKVWNDFQKTLPKKERSTVIYGHDSKCGLQRAATRATRTSYIMWDVKMEEENKGQMGSILHHTDPPHTKDIIELIVNTGPRSFKKLLVATKLALWGSTMSSKVEEFGFIVKALRLAEGLEGLPYSLPWFSVLKVFTNDVREAFELNTYLNTSRSQIAEFLLHTVRVKSYPIESVENRQSRGVNDPFDQS